MQYIHRATYEKLSDTTTHTLDPQKIRKQINISGRRSFCLFYVLILSLVVLGICSIMYMHAIRYR